MNPTKARDSISKIASREGWAPALEAAERIDAPWYRCQALAIAAEYVPDPHRQLKVLYDAVFSANQLEETNRIVTVSAWPVGAMVNLGFEAEADREIDRLLEAIQLEPSPVRRADALDCLLQKIQTRDSPAFWRVYDALFTACTTCLISGKRNTKGESLLVYWAGTIATGDPDRAKHLLDAIQGPNNKKRAREAIESVQRE